MSELVARLALADRVVLQRGDSDSKQQWGGQHWGQPCSFTVKHLQQALNGVGAVCGAEDGDFGEGTEIALKMFQWACAKVGTGVQDRLRQVGEPDSTMRPTGQLGEDSYHHLFNWLEQGWRVTGDLVRVQTRALSNVQAGGHLSDIKSPFIQEGDLVMSAHALVMLRDMNAIAHQERLQIVVNQALRISGEPVRGAVVKPASRSQHLIGHAIDCNLVDGASWNNSADFKAGRQTAAANRFVAAMTYRGYRWGGDFTPMDTPHFDLQINPRSFDYDAKFFLNQVMISEGHEVKEESL